MYWQRYNWNTVENGIKHHTINQSFTRRCLFPPPPPSIENLATTAMRNLSFTRSVDIICKIRSAKSLRTSDLYRFISLVNSSVKCQYGTNKKQLRLLFVPISLRLAFHQINKFLILDFVNPFPNNPWFLRKSLENTVGNKDEQLLPFPQCFLPVWRTSANYIRIKVIVDNLFQFGRV